eukprot:UN18325
MKFQYYTKGQNVRAHKKLIEYQGNLANMIKCYNGKYMNNMTTFDKIMKFKYQRTNM